MNAPLSLRWYSNKLKNQSPIPSCSYLRNFFSFFFSGIKPTKTHLNKEGDLLEGHGVCHGPWGWGFSPGHSGDKDSWITLPSCWGHTFASLPPSACLHSFSPAHSPSFTFELIWLPQPQLCAISQFNNTTETNWTRPQEGSRPHEAPCISKSIFSAQACLHWGAHFWFDWHDLGPKSPLEGDHTL